MSYVTYKLTHFLGIFTLITALAATSAHVLRGGTRADQPNRRVLVAAHGIAAFLIVLGGFGMLARMGLMHSGLPGWIHVKLLIWLVLAAAVALPWLGRCAARAVLIALPILTVAAGASALLKPL